MENKIILTQNSKQRQRTQNIDAMNFWTGLKHLHLCVVFEFFLNNTNLTFLAVLYKFDIEGFQNQQKNAAFTGN